MATIKITKQELWDIGFEKVVIDGVEYVDKTPLITDSSSPLTIAYCKLVEKKKNEYYQKQRSLNKENGKGKRKRGKK